MKFAQRGMAVLCFTVPLLLFSCGNHDINKPHEMLPGKVTFFNESSFTVNVHHQHFGGSLLIEKLSPGSSRTLELEPSNNYGNGDMFSIRYWHLVASGAELACGDVWTGFIDPNMQIQQNIESGSNHVIQIPNPSSKLELRETFVKIANASNMPFEFNYLSSFYRQACDGGDLPVAPGKIGVYRVSDFFIGKIEIKGYTITQGFEQYPFPELIAENGYIYSYEFNGNSVQQTGVEQL
ncbi:MAG: hypothetical protein LBU89_02530 [Fibromonadaceae bacterium]|nr:hypothetical protein [Fibromonadaceae bacterium]